LSSHLTAQTLTKEERRLILAVQDGLPVVARPYEAVADKLGLTEERVITLLQSLMEKGIITRLGAVLNHLALGFTANGMAVWDVPDGEVATVGAKVASFSAVTHCYRRPRRLPDWPYNLYAMLHGRSRREVLETAQRIAAGAGISHYPHDVLFSARQFRKRGMRLSPGTAGRRRRSISPHTTKD
jgi:DNA-binding Lrp family transcriptional regulator